MYRDGPTTTHSAAGGTGSFGAAIEAVAGRLAAMRPLRREIRRLMGRYEDGSAGPEDLHRYTMARLRLLMLESANRGVRQPRRVGEVMADKRRLDFVELVGHRDQFPEPQPS